MLKKEDAKRVEQNPTYNWRSRKLYIFDCAGGCGKELRVQSQSLKRRTGFCVRCVKCGGHPYQTIYNGMLTSIKRTNVRDGRNIQCKLSFEDFLFLAQIGCCCYCNAKVKWNEYKPGPYNLDRMDSSKDYEPGNVVVCCFGCNRRKGNFYSHEEFTAISEFLRTWRTLSKTGKMGMMLTISELREQ